MQQSLPYPLSSLDTNVLLVLVTVGVVLIVSSLNTGGKIKLPGPRPWPVVGNLLQIGEDAAITYAEWAKVYGPVFKVVLGEREVVVVNSAAAAKELFIDQGSTYISRPMFHTFHKVVSSTAGFTIGTSPWDESCKRKRKAAATALNRVYVQTYVPIIDSETLSLIEELYKDTDKGRLAINPFAYLQRLALNVSLVVNYGSRLDKVGDGLLKEIVEVETEVAQFRSVSGTPSDYIPLLRYLPSLTRGGTKEKAVEIRKRRDRYMNLLLDDLKERVKKGTDIACITGNILKDPEAKLNDMELSSICLSMVSAGLDTLANTLIWSMGFLAKHPEIQEKAYRAMYDVYKGDIPDSSEEKVDYITALHKECSRYFSIIKLSLPRATLGDSQYRGVHIPDGTTVFLNAYAIHNDEERYEDAKAFRPERYLEKKEENLQAHYSFGAGRRMCAGVHLANREMYIAFCKIIYFFKILPSDVKGEEDFDICPETACANPRGLSHAPKDFKIRFVPRDRSTIEEWIASEKNRAELQMAAEIKARI
ncbi:putative cytochrome P450 monooxygenase/Phenylacetate hydroxylase [Violaceomyces palustris]|uniref:Cytochrome P450 monooxygenase/Phenylacetate hydroxylase n=1 Tax=Violaceomyces palustris TaxID=1673888 RepID=A0ACD0P576_9BASI|nr:putative cytochrome P450 monooxygenase/Phenylacetate hydroxylase [Violaceomyces palustris]